MNVSEKKFEPNKELVGTAHPKRAHRPTALTFGDMRMKTIAILVALVLTGGCNHSKELKPALKHQTDETLLSGATNDYVLATSYTEGVIGIPVWQVIAVQKPEGLRTHLFTVERVWQEPEPGPPHIQTNDNGIIFTDNAESYAYSISTHSFTTNRWPYSVYGGDYRRE